MKLTIPLAKIGNSHGIRLNKQLLSRYGIEKELELETTPDSIILRPNNKNNLTWEETYRQMAATENEDWSEWEAVAEDGLGNED